MQMKDGVTAGYFLLIEWSNHRGIVFSVHVTKKNVNILKQVN